MNGRFLFDVFLSHSSKDKPVVHNIAQRLRADGLQVWLDEWEIKAGDSIPAKLEEGLERSRVLVLCMSEHAFGAEWPKLEASTFRFRDPLNNERRFIPLRLDEAPVKNSLGQYVCINWLPQEHEASYAKLLEACRPLAKKSAPEADQGPKMIKEKSILLKTKRAGAYAFSPDGKRVLGRSSSKDAEGKDLGLWNLDTGRRVRVFKGHTREVWGTVWSADQRRALSCGPDETMRLWDVETGHCLRVLQNYSDTPRDVAWSADQRRALSCGLAGTIQLWDLEKGSCLRILNSHAGALYSVAWSADQRRAFTGNNDGTVRLWDLEMGKCLRVLEGHAGPVYRVVWNVDQSRILSCSSDKTVRLWDVESGRCLSILEGHTGMVFSAAWSVDQRHALSGSMDQTIRVWDVETGHCLHTLEGHKGMVFSVAWSPDGHHALSGDSDGGVRIWDLQGLATQASAPRAPARSVLLGQEQVQYTNAKVLLVGETGAGKTGLTERLAQDRPPQRGLSTSGAWSTQWTLKDLPQKTGWEREVWLWDFGGQADQRLVHQLYLDRAALVLLMFNADQERVLPGLREWQQALARSLARNARTFLVAGRTDVGFRFDRQKVRAYAAENDYEYFETSAATGSGIAELRKAILEKIPWGELTRHNSPALFKRLKDEILKLRDEGHVLTTFRELESILRDRLLPEMRFAEAQLETVVSLLDSPGVVKELGFGTYVLLRPEWINIYAQAVIRTLRAAESGLGCLPVSSIVEGKLSFQTIQSEGTDVAERRLRPADERIVLQTMEQMLLERRLCLRQNGDLVFPSYCGLERPLGPVPQKFFVSYKIRGFLDDIYATLVVKLAHCGAFKLKVLWRDAADFETLADRRILGIKLARGEDDRGELLAHNAPGVTGQEQVIFASYIHEHLIEKSSEEVPRLRFYTCPEPTCDEPVKNRELAMELLEKNGDKARIRCQRCDKFIPLWDVLEKRFASESIKKKVEELRQHESADLDSRRQGKLLALEVAARVTSANQKCHEIPGDLDEGIDLVVEFTDDEGHGTGKHMYLQLKAGNSFLKKRKSDGAQIFSIKKQRWVKYWTSQDSPMMLVIGTFPEESERGAVSENKMFAQVRWMEIGDLLRSESDNGKKPVKQIVFNGERLDALSVRRWRDKVLGPRPL